MSDAVITIMGDEENVHVVESSGPHDGENSSFHNDDSSEENDSGTEHSSENDNEIDNLQPIEMKVRTMLSLVAKIPKGSTFEAQGGLGAWCTQPQQQHDSRQFLHQVVEAVHTVRSFSYEDAAVAPECAAAVAHAEQWLESLGVNVRDHMMHELRLVVIHREEEDPSAISSDGIGSPVTSCVESASIPILNVNRAEMLELSRNRIQNFAKFKPHNDPDPTGEKASFLSWFRKDVPTPIEDPTIHKPVRVFSRQSPGILLGTIDVAVRLFPASSSNFVFNEYDKEAAGTLNRTEFAAFVRDLSLAGGNLERLEDNIRNPGRNSCVGTVLGLKAPDVDLLSYIGAHHSLSMWAFKPDPNLKQDDTAEERFILSVQLLVWSVGINSVGPAMAELYSEWYNQGRQLNTMRVYATIIIADSVGQILISVMFRLKHSAALKRTLMVTPDVVVPDCNCSWSWPTRSVQLGLECCYKSVCRAVYDFSCVRLPVGVTVVVIVAMLYCFLRFELWQFAGSIIKTLPSARFLEGFKLAFIWGLRTQFGAVQGKILEEEEASTYDKNRAAILNRVDLLQAMLGEKGSASNTSTSSSSEKEWKGNEQAMLEVAISSCNTLKLSAAINYAEERLAEVWTEEALVERAPWVRSPNRKLKFTIEQAKRELVLAKVNDKFGAIIALWPPTQLSGLASTISADDSFDDEGDESSLSCCWHCAVCDSLRCCCFVKKSTDEKSILLTSNDRIGGIEITGGAKRGGGTFQKIPEEMKGDYRDGDRWGVFLMHRDGQWPNGLPDTSVAHNPLSFTNELEVEMSVVFGAGGHSNSNPPPSSSDDDESLLLSQSEWDQLVRTIAASPIYSFPLNPLKELVYNLNHYDELRKIATQKEYHYKALSRQDRFFLNTSKKEIQQQIDKVLELGGDIDSCFPFRKPL